VIKLGESSLSGETLLLKASIIDEKNPKCPVICDGHHKYIGGQLVWVIAGLILNPQMYEVEPEMSERIAREANIAGKTRAEIGALDTLKSIVLLRQRGVYTKQADLPFAGEKDRGNYQNFWYRSSAVIIAKCSPESVAKLNWQVCRDIVEGMPFEDAVLKHKKSKNEQKVPTGDVFRTCWKMAEAAAVVAPEAKNSVLYQALEATCKGEGDVLQAICSAHFSEIKNTPKTTETTK
jgi:hypothetical protein